jgi:hypothetical protein
MREGACKSQKDSHSHLGDMVAGGKKDGIQEECSTSLWVREQGRPGLVTFFFF